MTIKNARIDKQVMDLHDLRLENGKLKKELSKQDEKEEQKQGERDERGDDDRNRDMMLQLMMGNMIAMRADEAERRAQAQEEEMLRQAIEMSRADSGIPAQQNPDELTYEELL